MGLRNFLHRRLSPLIYSDGTSIVPARIRHKWPERQFLRQFLRRLNVDCIIDVGANIGAYGSELRALGYRGLIISFEPDPECFRELTDRSAKDPMWLAFDTALGSAEGSGEFNIMEVRLFNSFRAPSTEETRTFENSNKVTRRITVPISTLDKQFPELQRSYRFARPYLKMDTQGFDIEIFQGAKSVLDRFVAMQSEISVKRIYEGTLGWRDAIAVYEAEGFELAALYDVNPQFPELVELDCYFLRSR